MSSKRKDNKGRVLHNGEYQQSNGRYRYKYYDGIGTARYLYSWRLDKNDRMPESKKNGPSLREQEREIQTTQYSYQDWRQRIHKSRISNYDSFFGARFLWSEAH